MSLQHKNHIVLQNGGDPIQIGFDDLRGAVLVFRAINHGFRKKIIGLLDNSREMTVTEIFVELRVEQSIASQHLGILRKADVVKTRRDGKFMYYSLNIERLAYLAEVVKQLGS